MNEDKAIPLSGWRRLAYIWAHNLKYWSGDDGSGWMPVGSTDLGKALVEAAEETTKMEQALRELDEYKETFLDVMNGPCVDAFLDCIEGKQIISAETKQILENL